MILFPLGSFLNLFQHFILPSWYDCGIINSGYQLSNRVVIALNFLRLRAVFLSCGLITTYDCRNAPVAFSILMHLNNISSCESFSNWGMVSQQPIFLIGSCFCALLFMGKDTPAIHPSSLISLSGALDSMLHLEKSFAFNFSYFFQPSLPNIYSVCSRTVCVL